ncbi:MAG: hypothetical protein RL264_1412 [Bacteroidota bacterium]
MGKDYHFNSFVMDLKKLKSLLSQPRLLKSQIDELRKDPSLSDEIKGFIVLFDSFGGDCAAVKQYLDNTETFIVSKEKTVKFSFPYLKYAAILLLFLSIGGMLYYGKSTSKSTTINSKNNPEIFVEPGIPIFMGNKQTIDWAPLMYAIKKESRAKAISEWRKIQKIAPENDTVLYFGGLIYFNANQIQKAEKYFKRNRQIQSTYNDRSLYFIAMIDWKRNKREEAKKKFQQLTSSTDLELKKAAKNRIKEIENTSE